MPEPKIAAYGSWSSPITADLIVASSIGLGDILLDGEDIYWLESRPQEGGRSVIVRRAADGASVDVTPPAAISNGGTFFNVRTRVHEYGGGAYLVHNGIVYFCNDADQRLYRQEAGAPPVAITPDPARSRGMRYADGVMDGRRGRMIWVRKITDLPDAVQKLSLEMRNVYVLSYFSKNPVTDGRYRKVKVEVTPRSDTQQLRVTWRRGYFVPGD